MKWYFSWTEEGLVTQVLIELDYVNKEVKKINPLAGVGVVRKV